MIPEILDIPLLISALAFFATFSLSIGILQYIRRYAKRRELIEGVRQDAENAEVLGESSLSPNSGGVVDKGMMSFLGSLGRHAASDKSADYPQIRLKFLKAGLNRAQVPAVFWGVKTLLAAFFPVCFFLLRISVFNLFSLHGTLCICLSLCLLGFYLPDIWLRVRTDRRRTKITEGLPDALDLLVVCVEAGMGMDAAISRVAKEMKLTNKVLSDDLKLLTLELKAGKARQDALRNLAMRTDIEDLNNLVTLLIQTDKFGTSVGKALRVYSDTFRTKRQQRAEEIAAKLPVKLLFPLIAFIFPSLFIAILGPAIIRIQQVFFTGQ